MTFPLAKQQKLISNKKFLPLGSEVNLAGIHFESLIPNHVRKRGQNIPTAIYKCMISTLSSFYKSVRYEGRMTYGVTFSLAPTLNHLTVW